MRIAGTLLVGQRVELYRDEMDRDPYLSGILTSAELTQDGVRLVIATDRQPAVSAEVEEGEEEPPAGARVARPSGWT